MCDVAREEGTSWQPPLHEWHPPRRPREAATHLPGIMPSSAWPCSAQLVSLYDSLSNPAHQHSVQVHIQARLYCRVDHVYRSTGGIPHHYRCGSNATLVWATVLGIQLGAVELLEIAPESHPCYQCQCLEGHNGRRAYDKKGRVLECVTRS